MYYIVFLLKSSFDILFERNVSAIKNVSAVASSLDSFNLQQLTTAQTFLIAEISFR